MIIRIDGKEIEVKDPNKNIVEIGDENGISIIAPCVRNGRKHGCCKACVIEIDGKREYACGTKAKDGMTITYDREDLNILRKERLNAYVENIKSGKSDGNSCSGKVSDIPKNLTESSELFSIKKDDGCGCN